MGGTPHAYSKLNRQANQACQATPPLSHASRPEVCGRSAFFLGEFWEIRMGTLPFRPAEAQPFAVTSRAKGADSAWKALEQLKPWVDLRLCSETVNQTGFSKYADALSLRGRLAFESGKNWDTALLAEADLLWPLQGSYNGTVNHKTTYPVVADPEKYALNPRQL